MYEKNYNDLESSVWHTGKCACCGACVAVCPANSLFFETGENSTHPLNDGYCKSAVDGVPCGACYEVCPRVNERKIETIGNSIDIVSASANFDVEKKQSGGAVTAILMNALEQGLVDAVITVTEDSWNLKPKSILITSGEMITKQAGSRYNWWVPLLSALKEAVITKKYRNIAIVGVPCVVQAIHEMRKSEHDLIRPFRDSIRLIIGLFCTETFDYEKMVEGKFKKEMGIDPWQIRRLDVTGKLEITTDSGEIHTIPLSEVDDCIRPGCAICTDLTALDADISAGSIGSPQGQTTLIIRTPVGNKFFMSAVDEGKLGISDKPDLRPIEKLANKKAKRKA